MKVNTHALSLPLVGDSPASLIGNKPARKQGGVRRVERRPEAPGIAPEDLDDPSGALGAPVALEAASVALIASYRQCPVDLRFVADGLGERWLVPEYTNQRADEIRIDHVTTLGQALETFPGSRVAVMRDANHVLAEAQSAPESIKAQVPKEKRGALSQIDTENTRCQVKGSEFSRPRGERAMQHVEEAKSSHSHPARPPVQQAYAESFTALGATICLSSESLGDLWLVPAYTTAPRRELAAPHAAVAIGALSRLPGLRVVGVADRAREAGSALGGEALS